MPLTKRFIHTLLTVGLMSVLTLTSFADTIRLKDGSIVKGRITGFSGGKFTVTIGEGARQRSMTFSADEVDTVEFDNTILDSGNVSMETPKRSTSPRVITTDNTSAQPTTERKTPPVVVVTSAPPTKPPVASNTQTTPPQPENKPSTIKPIELTINVLADDTANGWTNSGWIVKKGQRIKITSTGEVSLGNGQSTTASGRYDLEDNGKLMSAVATGALLAVIGDDNNDFIYVGSEREFVAARDGALFLGVNENNLSDNSGSFSVKIEIYP